MTQFVLLFRVDPAAQREGMSTPEKAQRAMEAWVAWKARLEAGGHLVGNGPRMQQTGRVVRGRDKAVTDGPFLEAKDLVAGLAFVQATDLDQATELAQGCPILADGGSVEVRPGELTVTARPRLDEHLFRRESGRLVAALTRVFGVQNLGLVEDVVQDAFCRALEIWPERGVPDNPSGWLLVTAKHRALDVLRRDQRGRVLVDRIRDDGLRSTVDDVLDAAFEPGAIRDEQLRMMFSCCSPRLPEEVQLALVLNLLCGFGASEIADAFLASRAAVEKRITRGKQALASAGNLVELTDGDFTERLSTVRRALYLLFNEGYHGASAKAAVRKPSGGGGCAPPASLPPAFRTELCGEAIRLTALLCEHPPAATPVTEALAALLCLHAARLPARVDEAGELAALVDQDRTRWDAALVAQGLALFERSAAGVEVSTYHVEAAIAVVHASAASLDETDWARIVDLYDQLAALAPSPVVDLNRAIAIGQRDGPDAGLRALRSLQDPRLAQYPFHAAAMGELELRRHRPDRARAHLATALSLARNDPERHFFARRLSACGTERC